MKAEKNISLPCFSKTKKLLNLFAIKVGMLLKNNKSEPFPNRRRLRFIETMVKVLKKACSVVKQGVCSFVSQKLQLKREQCIR